MSLLAMLALQAAVALSPRWMEFDRRRRGWSETPAYFDAASVEQGGGGRVRVWVVWENRLSGLPDPQISSRLEIDCGRRRVRTLARFVVQGSQRFRSPRPSRSAAIERGSEADVLARRLCAGCGD